jgi:DsbE subfamily thiol:disulfide oxidoreductase
VEAATAAVPASLPRLRTAAARTVTGWRRALAVASLLLPVLGSCTSGGEQPAGVARKDDPLPSLSGVTLDGAPIDAGEYGEGRILVINVWADWCDPCRREQPLLVDLAERYEAQGVRFLGINYQDDRDAARAWVEGFDVPYPSLFDPWGRSAAHLGFPALPDTYIVDRDGKIRWVVFGETNDEELSGLIEDVLA